MDAKNVFDVVRSALDGRNWRYDADEEKKTIVLSVNGDDLPIRIFFIVDEERKLIRVLSPMSFKAPEDKRVEMSVAVCAANLGLISGSFDYNIEDGSIMYRLVSTFRGCEVGTATVDFLIDCICIIVDEYNDKFMAVSKGFMSIEDFIKSAG